MHHRLLEHQDSLTAADLIEHAAAFALDTARFMRDLGECAGARKCLVHPDSNSALSEGRGAQWVPNQLRHLRLRSLARNMAARRARARVGKCKFNWCAGKRSRSLFAGSRRSGRWNAAWRAACPRAAGAHQPRRSAPAPVRSERRARHPRPASRVAACRGPGARLGDGLGGCRRRGGRSCCLAVGKHGLRPARPHAAKRSGRPRRRRATRTHPQPRQGLPTPTPKAEQSPRTHVNDVPRRHQRGGSLSSMT
jgi:hypothetical protein